MSITEGFRMIGDNRLSFADEVVGEDRQNMMDLLVYAEMYATQAVAHNRQPEAWHEFYHACLLRHGCRLVSFLAQSTARALTPQHVRDFKVVLVERGENEVFVQLVSQSLAAMQLEEKAARHFASSAMPQREAEKALLCKVSPCYTDAHNQPYLGFCGLVMRYEVEVDHGFLTDVYHRFVTLTPHGGCYLFDRGVYAEHRTLVLQNTERLSEWFFAASQAQGTR